MKQIAAFLKFGRKVYVEKLIDGEMRFSSLETLRQREAIMQKGIGDAAEGSLYANKVSNVMIYDERTGIGRPINVSKFRINISDAGRILVYCCTAVYQDEIVDGKIILPAERIEWFKTHFSDYDSFAVILPADTFINDMKKAFPEIKHRSIVYQDKAHDSFPHMIDPGRSPAKGVTFYSCDDFFNAFSFTKDVFFQIEGEYRFALVCDKPMDILDVQIKRSYQVEIHSMGDAFSGCICLPSKEVT